MPFLLSSLLSSLYFISACPFKFDEQSAKVIVDIKEELPEVVKELTTIAKIEEDKASMLEELQDESKVTYQVEKVEEKKKNKRKKRTRPGKR